ncbi:zf-HC2 domain-containing protein [Symbioplanes lichenis]|uniref:zf-HC2 domain-containing protein n=1 Tax=Symbioplanes lichenis TaxID=1629072 RepID=UPI002738D3AB|nr:zf-HC2 domain-containing protein [Actinoplanes lichenis]
MTHPHQTALARYAEGAPGLDDAAVWTIEAHLETCPDCRARLVAGLPADTLSLLDRVGAELDRALETEPAPARPARRWGAARRRWLAGTMLPWVVMTVAVLICAAALERATPVLPSLVLLLAPIAPLPGVAVAWSRRTDPAWELIAATPGAGLAMLLRRAAAVLAVVVPALAVVGLVAGVGASLALALLPSLACVAAAVALGGRIGVRRAAIAVGSAWALAVILPSLSTNQLSVALHPGAAPVWALAAAALVALALTRADDYRRLASSA